MERTEAKSQRRRRRRKRDDPEDGHTATESQKGRHIFGSATAERFVLRRSKRAPREPIREVVVASDDAPSFIGHGVSGRARYLLDSILRLSRSSNHTMLGMIVTMLVVVCFILLIVDRLAGKCMKFYEYQMRSKASPFKLLSDVLIKYSTPTSWTVVTLSTNHLKSYWVIKTLSINVLVRSQGKRLLLKMAGIVTLEAARAAIDQAEGVIFDNDGTLVNSMPVYYRAWKKATESLGLSFPETQFYKLAGKSASAILNILNKEQGKNVPFETLQAAKVAALEHEFNTIGAIEPVVELAHYAKKQNKLVAVASGGHRKNVLRSLRGIGLEPTEFFECVTTTEDVTNGKPHPESFLLTANRIGVDPAKCVGFEDGQLGLEALEAAKMVAIDVRRFPGYPVPEVLKVAS